MLELICVLAGITLLFLLFAQARPDDGIRAAVLAAAAWFALYAVVSVLLFAADIFTIRLAAGITGWQEPLPHGRGRKRSFLSGFAFLFGNMPSAS